MMCCKNELNLTKLCVENACIDNLTTGNTLCSPQLSSPAVCTASVITQTLNSQSACIGSLNAPSICSTNLMATNAGISNLVANDLCVPGTLMSANLLNCGKYRATTTFSANTTYTLGSPLNWNLTLDDPNSNVTLSPTVYTVPVTGYYLTTIQILQQNILPASGSPILGTPVALIELIVNGVISRQVFIPYLSFVGQQNSLLSAMLSLNAGDKVTSDFKVLAVDPVSGLIPVVGTVTIDADGTNHQSVFSIHLLSVTCASAPCAPSVACTPGTPTTCTPCVPPTGTGSGSCTSGMIPTK